MLSTPKRSGSIRTIAYAATGLLCTLLFLAFTNTDRTNSIIPDQSIGMDKVQSVSQLITKNVESVLARRSFLAPVATVELKRDCSTWS